MTRHSLFASAHACLMLNDPSAKIERVERLAAERASGILDTSQDRPAERIEVPGRPLRPRLVEASAVPRRGYQSRRGIISLVHAIAHIEFNAINLALDAVYRFRDMPQRYYDDWIRIAVEEATHFTLLETYLQSAGSAYGDLDAHNGLWEAAVKTDHDALVRMALVPRVLEARGLDVTPGMIRRLQSAGETELVEILEIINRDEIGHVEAGSRWFRWLCEQRGLDARTTFTALLSQHMKGAVRGPFEEQSRLQAGFTEDELRDLVAMSQQQ